MDSGCGQSVESQQVENYEANSKILKIVIEDDQQQIVFGFTSNQIPYHIISYFIQNTLAIKTNKQALGVVQITKKINNVFNLFFIDYGNESLHLSLEDLAQLTPLYSLSKEPPFAHKIQMHKIQRVGAWSNLLWMVCGDWSVFGALIVPLVLKCKW
ncbi:hypothetical protein BpHYR1_005093 [Brachionus plicatilis]|uniref:Tudor domain-containing protein n=1 Tax=Brachionus plicatilis TaxID=10195 RepID=A0A3M7QY89_BRAPC|nr:hypothetical protein BpHYR1_005093 [Brachionus plicatilis]